MACMASSPMNDGCVMATLVCSLRYVTKPVVRSMSVYWSRYVAHIRSPVLAWVRNRALSRGVSWLSSCLSWLAVGIARVPYLGYLTLVTMMARLAW